MKTPILIFTILGCLLTSCYKVYDPRIDTAQKVLVVDGMITNKTNAYHILLTYANAFNSIGPGLPVNTADVYVTDNLENRYIFHERENGNYISDSLQFTGIPGRSYRLHIITPDKVEYESDPQRIFPEVSPDNIYAEFDNKEILERSSGLKVNTHGANILIDITNQSDSLSRFRITSNLVMQYFYIVYIPMNWPTVLIFNLYCWQTVNANTNIDLAGMDFSLNSASIRKHPVCFMDDNYSVYALYYKLKLNWEDTIASTSESNSFKYYDIHHRILYLNQYTLNNETYVYYKSLDEQMQSEGKLFDPVASQLNGNIKCITDPEKKAIGFFEASSVSYSAYIVDFRNLKNSQPALIKTPYILPPAPNGCMINRLQSTYQDHNIPLFWIFI